MSTNISKRQKKFLKLNVIWTAILIGIAVANLTYTIYVFPSSVQVLEQKEVLEDPLESWSEANYIVWQYNSTHYACRNMSTNLAEYFGTSDDNAIQWGIDNSTTYGGTVFVRPAMYTGTYNAAVTLKDKVRLVVDHGAAGITVTIDSGATATLEDFHNYDFKRWDSGVLVTFVEDRSQQEPASYEIFKEGSFYFIKNCSTGEIETTTTNATTAIQTALDSFGSSGGRLFIKEGQYDVTAHIYVPSNVTISGEGHGTHIQQISNIGFGAIFFVGPGPAIAEADWNTSAYTKNVIIEDMYISSNISGNGTKGNGVSFLACSQLILRNLWFEDLNQGFETHGRASDVFISNIYIYGTDTYAFSLQPSISDWWDIHDIIMSNIIVSGANMEGYGTAGAWLNGWNLFLDKCSLLNSDTGVGLEVCGEDITVSNTIMNNTNTSGFWVKPVVDAVTNSSRITFTNCEALNSGAYGFFIQLSNDVGIYDSIVYNVANGFESVYLHNSTRVTISGLKSIDDRSPQVILYDVSSSSGADYISVVGCDFSRGKGIVALSGLPHVIVKDNLGFITQNSGITEASNDDYIAHGLYSTPTVITLAIEETDANYFLQIKTKNATHFQIYLYDHTAGAAETVDKTIHWHVEYNM